jgi:hypothetical protein
MTFEYGIEKPSRVIHTARDLESINQAVAEGFFPLVKGGCPEFCVNGV